jgi:hypothetical protein
MPHPIRSHILICRALGKTHIQLTQTDLAIYVNACDRNVPQLIKIPPRSRQDTVLKLKSEKSINQLTGFAL